MIEKRFQKTRIVDKWGGIYDSKNDEILGVNDVEHKLNEQQDIIKAKDSLLSILSKENEQLRQKIKHWVYVDVDNANGCMNCKYDIGSICSILDCETHDYLMGVSECGLKYWGYKDGREKIYNYK